MYFQDNQDCNSSTFKLHVQENRDFSRTLLQDLCVTTTQDCTGTFSQDFCRQDTSEFTSKLDHTYRAQGATGGFVELSTVAVLTSSTNTCELLAQGCTACGPDSSASFMCAESAFSLDMVRLHKRVFASGLPNYKGLWIPLTSKLNIVQWQSSLQDYHDNVIVDYLEFGWPVGYDYDKYGFPVSQLRNHSGAISFPNELDIYLEAELARYSIAGPFYLLPFVDESQFHL